MRYFLGGLSQFLSTIHTDTHHDIWQSVVQSKNTCSGTSQRPKLSTIKCGHKMDGWPLCARFCACNEISPESVQTLQKSFGWDHKLRSPVCVCVCKKLLCIQKYHVFTSKIQQPMSEFGGLWKHQNNPACTKTKCQTESLHNVEVGHWTEESN